VSRRLERLNVLFRQELSDLIRRRVKDPRIAEFVTITRVDVAPDMETARIFISVMGGEDEKKSTIVALGAASGYLRRELSSILTIRRVPQLHFFLDESLEEGDRILRLIDEISPKHT